MRTFPKWLRAELSTTDPDVIAATFSGMLADPAQLIGWMVVVVLIGFLVCRLGLQKGVERITKIMMAALFVIMIALCIRTVTLPGAGEGIAFYLIPDFGKLFAGNTPAEQWATFGQAVYAAMGQAFFSLSLGIAAMEIFGSYIGRERSLTGEAISVTALNTVVAILAGLIIFPACFAYGVTPDSGPSLVFVTLPAVFAEMPLGNVWGSAFLRVHELCGSFHGYCRVRESRKLDDGQIRHVAQPCRYHNRHFARAAELAVRARFQRAF